MDHNNMTDYDRFKQLLEDFKIRFEEYARDPLPIRWIYVIERTGNFYHTFEFYKETGQFKLHDIHKE